MIKKTYIIISGIIVLLSVFVSLVYAQYAMADCGGAQTTVINCGGKGQDAIINVLKMVIKIMTGGVGILVVGAVIAGGIVYSSAAGSPGQLKKAQTIWTNALVGLILFASMVAILNFLIPGGVF